MLERRNSWTNENEGVSIEDSVREWISIPANVHVSAYVLYNVYESSD